jgi:hypothetical protein
MKSPVVVRPAARQASRRPPDSSHPRKLEKTVRTFVNVTSRARAHWKRQTVTAYLVPDAEIAAGGTPFGTMRQNPPPARARLRH